jgi:hypothetical protein
MSTLADTEIRMRVAVVGTQSKVRKPRERLEFIY